MLISAQELHHNHNLLKFPEAVLHAVHVFAFLAQDMQSLFLHRKLPEKRSDEGRK